MRKRQYILIALLFLLCFALPARATEQEGTDAWTVLVYMCGSDLESKHCCATGNLEEIATVANPTDELQTILSGRDGAPHISTAVPGQVNVLIETGGASAWHAQELGMQIRTDALQIWQYNPGQKDKKGTFSLEAERPLASMAQPETLSDFIRWGTGHYPAQKYALVLWSHGGGSATGIFIDELFDNEYMTLDLLNQALGEGGAHFEAVLFDACMMANIETACAIQEHASWMIASEELVAGKGTAIGDWLQQLYCVPGADGRLLGRWICDTAMIKYGNSTDRQSQELITWSVIDLSRVQRLEANFDRVFELLSYYYTHYPDILARYAKAVVAAEPYGTGHEMMYDLGGMISQPMLRDTVDAQTQKEVQEALADAIYYCVRGAGRPGARGLSFCFASSFLSDALDVYAHNCPSPHYLAMLDAISPWKAPARVYEQVEKMPELLNEEAYHVTVEKTIWTNGSPAFVALEGGQFISAVEYNLYKKDEETGQMIRLGEVPVYYKSDEGIYRVYDLVKWPSLNGNLCQIELQNQIIDGVYNCLYNVPVMIDSEIMNMRVAYWFDRAEWEVLGLWEGYDNDSRQFNRNVMSLSQMAGREYRLMYEARGGKRSGKPYAFSPTMILYRSMNLKEIILPPGTYYIQFAVYDLFMRPMHMKMVEMNWDGERIQIQGEPWEGTETLDVSTYYSDLK